MLCDFYLPQQTPSVFWNNFVMFRFITYTDRGVWFLLQVLNDVTMRVTFEIFGNGCHPTWLSKWPTTCWSWRLTQLSGAWYLLKVWIKDPWSSLLRYFTMAVIQNGQQYDTSQKMTINSSPPPPSKLPFLFFSEFSKFFNVSSLLVSYTMLTLFCIVLFVLCKTSHRSDFHSLIFRIGDVLLLDIL